MVWGARFGARCWPMLLVGLFFIFAGFVLQKDTTFEDQAFEEEYEETLIALAETGEARDEELFSDEVPPTQILSARSRTRHSC